MDPGFSLKDLPERVVCHRCGSGLHGKNKCPLHVYEDMESAKQEKHGGTIANSPARGGSSMAILSSAPARLQRVWGDNLARPKR